MLVARSSPECHLYIELHPCACGEAVFAAKHRTVSRDGQLVAVYEGPCRRCGAQRSFEFVLAEEIPPRPPAFGGDAPSTILDAGEFLHAADRFAKLAPPDLARAIACLDEVLKLIPPGHDRVPEESIVSAVGRAVYTAEPGRFRRPRLVAVRDTYRGLLNR